MTMPGWVEDLGALAVVGAIAFGPALLYGWVTERVLGKEAKDWIGGVLIVLGPIISVFVLVALDVF